MQLKLDKFKLIAGDVSLEFVNTLSGYIRVNDEEGNFKYSSYGDKITEYIDLLSWAVKAGLIEEKWANRLLSAAGDRPDEAARIVKKATKFRNVLYRLFKASIGSWQPDERDVSALNAELLDARRNERLVPKGNQMVFEWTETDLLELPIMAVAKAAAELYTSDLIERIRECRGERCGWLFIDCSRSRNRLWCDMKDCGNLAKVRRFRSTRRKAQA